MKKLRELRKQRALTLKQVSQDLYISVPVLSRYERGVQTPSFQDIVQFVIYYDTTYTYLTGDWSYGI